METRSPIRVFEEVPDSAPRLYRDWGEWMVVRWYEQFVEAQGRHVLHFVIGVPD